MPQQPVQPDTDEVLLLSLPVQSGSNLPLTRHQFAQRVPFDFEGPLPQASHLSAAFGLADAAMVMHVRIAAHQSPRVHRHLVHERESGGRRLHRDSHVLSRPTVNRGLGTIGPYRLAASEVCPPAPAPATGKRHAHSKGISSIRPIPGSYRTSDGANATRRGIRGKSQRNR